MTNPTPQLIVLNEADGPGLRILQYCPVCKENVTESLFSADDFMSVDAAGMVGDFDAHAWLDHVAARHQGAS